MIREAAGEASESRSRLVRAGRESHSETGQVKSWA